MLAGIMTDFGSPTGAGRVRRPRRVRRRDDRRVPAPAHRGRCSPARTCAPGTRSGATAAARHRHREQLRRRDATASSAHGDSEIRADGRFSLGYPRADGGEEINARIRVIAPRRSTACATRSASTTTRCRAAVGRVPPHRRVPAAARLRRDDHRRGRRLRRAVRDGDRVAALRRRRRAARHIADRQRRRRGHRRGVRRLGLDLLVQRRRRARIPVEQHRGVRAIRARRCRGSSSSPPAAAARSTRRATTCGSASAICSSATKASAR